VHASTAAMESAMTILLTSLLVFAVIVGSVALIVTSLQMVAFMFERIAAADIVRRAEDLLRAHAGRSRRAW
jgi:hypothetical protein